MGARGAGRITMHGHACEGGRAHNNARAWVRGGGGGGGRCTGIEKIKEGGEEKQ